MIDWIDTAWVGSLFTETIARRLHRHSSCASRGTLAKRALYSGRKGRRALRRLVAGDGYQG